MNKLFKSIVVLSLMVALVVGLTGCKATIKEDVNMGIKGITVEDLNKLAEYKGSYVGDNSAVMNIAYNSYLGEFVSEFELKTSEKPYKIFFKIQKNDAEEEKFEEIFMVEDTKKVTLNMATNLFILVDNVDEINITVETNQPQEYVYSRKQIQSLFEKELKEYADNTDLWVSEVIEKISSGNALTPKKAEYKKITQEEAKEMIDTKEVIILDVRTESEFNEEHIKNAILLPLDSIKGDVSGTLPDKDALILVYCRSGNRSKAASHALIELGYTNVLDFGGINTWAYEKEK